MIKSMTYEERIKPEIINGSRRKRIAKGSGRSIQEVNQLFMAHWLCIGRDNELKENGSYFVKNIGNESIQL